MKKRVTVGLGKLRWIFLALVCCGFLIPGVARAANGPEWTVHVTGCEYREKLFSSYAPTPAGLAECKRNEVPKKVFEPGYNLTTIDTAFPLPGEEWEVVSGKSGSFQMIWPDVTVNCGETKSSGTVDGSSPGLGYLVFQYSKCTIAGAGTGCHMKGEPGGEGALEFGAYLELVYLGGQVKAEKKEPPYGVLIKPLLGNVYSLETTGCGAPLPNGHMIAQGTLLAEVKPPRAANPLAELIFPNPPLTEYWKWVGAKVEGFKAGLVGGLIHTGTENLEAVGSNETTAVKLGATS